MSTSENPQKVQASVIAEIIMTTSSKGWGWGGGGGGGEGGFID